MKKSKEYRNFMLVFMLLNVLPAIGIAHCCYNGKPYFCFPYAGLVAVCVFFANDARKQKNKWLQYEREDDAA